MTSNTLRGGKNQYSSSVRCGNWFEQKLEPREQKYDADTRFLLPAPNAKGWTTTAMEYNGGKPDFKPASTMSTDDFVSYQDVPEQVRFSSSYGTAFVACSEQVPPFKLATKDPAMVTESRKSWTGGEPWQFDRTTV